MDISELDPSELGTQEYWQRAYAREIHNFIEHGDPGDVWFGEDSTNRVIDWICRCGMDKATAIIDLGSGNGYTLSALAREGYTNLTGVDYCQEAITLAEKVTTTEFPNIKYKKFDITQDSGKELGKYGIVHDKGTYDAIGLNPEDPKQCREKYIEQVDDLLEEEGMEHVRQVEELLEDEHRKDVTQIGHIKEQESRKKNKKVDTGTWACKIMEIGGMKYIETVVDSEEEGDKLVERAVTVRRLTEESRNCIEVDEDIEEVCRNDIVVVQDVDDEVSRNYSQVIEDMKEKGKHIMKQIEGLKFECRKVINEFKDIKEEYKKVIKIFEVIKQESRKRMNPVDDVLDEEGLPSSSNTTSTGSNSSTSQLPKSSPNPLLSTSSISFLKDIEKEDGREDIDKVEDLVEEESSEEISQVENSLEEDERMKEKLMEFVRSLEKHLAI